MQPQTRPALVNEVEARRYLGGVSRATLYRLRAEGAITPVHFERAVRYSLTDLDQAIETLTDERADGNG